MKLKILAILVSCIGVIAIPISLAYFNTGKPKTEVRVEKEMVDTVKERINLIEEKRGVYIIEVDNHLYVSTVRGGIVHMESCPCKTRLK
jgi:hypothetical protein